MRESVLAGTALALFSYLLGSVPVGFLVVKIGRGKDIRQLGSGNIGATNVGRVMGRRWFCIVLFLDALKGLLPVLLAGWVSEHSWPSYELPGLVLLCGLMAICGHNFPVFLKFRGGKGVATSAGVFLYVFPLGTAISLCVWLASALLTRYVSVSSILAGLALAGSAFLLPKDPFGASRFLTIFCALAAAMIILRHRSNIRRLLTGTESRIKWSARACKKEEPNV